MYRELLDKFNKSEFHHVLWRIIVANEIDCMFDFDKSTYEEFEILAEFAYYWIMTTSATPHEVVQLLCWAIEENKITFDDIVNDRDRVIDYINERI